MHSLPTQLQKMQTEQEQLIAVNAQNVPIGPVEKISAHRNPATRHRAITVFLQNDQGEILITQRSNRKPLWPQWWDAACSTHQWWPKESAVEATNRRLPFEIGITAGQITHLQEVLHYQYQAKYSDQWTEHEVNYLVLGNFTGEPTPNQDEVSAWEWVPLAELQQELALNNHRFAPWFPLAVQELFQVGAL